MDKKSATAVYPLKIISQFTARTRNNLKKSHKKFFIYAIIQSILFYNYGTLYNIVTA